MKKRLYDMSIINERVIVIDEGIDEVGTMVGFEANKILVAYHSGWIKAPKNKVRIVDKKIRYIDRKTHKVLLEVDE